MGRCSDVNEMKLSQITKGLCFSQSLPSSLRPVSEAIARRIKNQEGKEVKKQSENESQGQCGWQAADDVFYRLSYYGYAAWFIHCIHTFHLL